MKKRWLVKIRRKGKLVFDLLGTERIRRNALQAIPFWIASLATGLIAVGFTKLFVYSEGLMKNIREWHEWSIFFLAPFCFLIAFLIVRLFAPNARGSGIPQVMAAIELSSPKHEHKIGQLLNFRIMLAKIGSSLMMVL